MNLLCMLLGHKLLVHAKPKESWGNGVRWLKCSRCKNDFVINDRIKAFLRMDFELMDMHKWERTGQ